MIQFYCYNFPCFYILCHRNLVDSSHVLVFIFLLLFDTYTSADVLVPIELAKQNLLPHSSSVPVVLLSQYLSYACYKRHSITLFIDSLALTGAVSSIPVSQTILPCSVCLALIMLCFLYSTENDTFW